MSSFLRKTLRDYRCKRSKMPAADPTYGRLLPLRTALDIEIRTYVTELVPVMKELGPHPETCDSDDHRRQMWRVVLPLLNNLRALGCLVAIALKMRQLKGLEGLGFADYLGGKESDTYRAYRVAMTFAGWLYRQTPRGRKDALASHRKSRNKHIEKRQKAEQRQKHYARFWVREGSDFVGPPPPPRGYRRRDDANDVNLDAAAE